MKKHQIAVLAGDGIGPEVTQWGQRVLTKAGIKHGMEFEFKEALFGHAAIEATGEPLPRETLELCQASKAVLMGAVGHPKYDNDPNAQVRPEQGLLKIRSALGLYANIRPITLFKALLGSSSLKPEILEGVDILFFRELTGGIYFGTPRERFGENEEAGARDTLVYTKKEVKRIARMAFEAAQNRTGRLCSVDKANVLESSRLWRETVQALETEYADVEVTHMFVDNAAMQLIKNPRQFDVVVTGNMFGDILTDEASQISGSLGLLPSASVGSQVGIYEPVHGSAPDIAGQGIANPLASILSAALLLEISMGNKAASDEITAAVDRFLEEGYRTYDTAGAETPADKKLDTEQCGKKILDYIAP